MHAAVHGSTYILTVMHATTRDPQPQQLQYALHDASHYTLQYALQYAYSELCMLEGIIKNTN